MERTPFQHGFEDALDRGWNASGWFSRSPDEYSRGYKAGEEKLASFLGTPAAPPTPDGETVPIYFVIGSNETGPWVVSYGSGLEEAEEKARTRRKTRPDNEYFLGVLRVPKPVPRPVQVVEGTVQ